MSVGAEMGSTHVRAAYFPDIVGLVTLLLSDCHETTVRGTTNFSKDEHATNNNYSQV